jgi:hypothetical protein
MMTHVFNKAKVKSWIRKTHKRQSFGFGHGCITDGSVLLVEEQHMCPTILEIFETLTPACDYSAKQFQELMTLPDKPVAMFDSELEYTPDAKQRLRIFYDPTTGEKLLIDSVYFDLLEDPRLHRFYADKEMAALWAIYDDKVVGVIAAVWLQDQLSHISFNVEAEDEAS